MHSMEAESLECAGCSAALTRSLPSCGPQTTGYCPWYGKPCRKFPVIIGETGSFMTDSTDNIWLNVRAWGG